MWLDALFSQYCTFEWKYSRITISQKKLSSELVKLRYVLNVLKRTFVENVVAVPPWGRLLSANKRHLVTLVSFSLEHIDAKLRAAVVTLVTTQRHFVIRPSLQWVFFHDPQNLSIAIVGKGLDFSIYEDAAVDPYLELVAGEAPAAGAAAADDGDEPAAGMETE